MITHVAVFRWKHGFPDTERQEWADRLRALPQRIESVRSVVVGDDQLRGGRSWDTAVVTVVDTMNALDEYVQDPEHQSIITISAPYIDQLAQVDFEV
jgi:Stress responsive A/B Barrel Domain